MKREIRDLYYSLVSRDKYLINDFGHTNLIITAPHGGGMKPLSIPTRKYGKKLMDTYTRRLSKELIKLLSYSPYYVISDIHRSKVDLNRSIEEAAQGNSKAEGIWNDWNVYIDWYKDEIDRIYGKGLLIDIHSQGKTKSFQLGYGISARTYNRMRNRESYTEKSTLSSLKQDEYEMIFGEFSIRESLKRYGYDVLTPKDDDIYFNGGRDIEHFSGNGLGAIQIECPTSVLKKDLNGVAIALKHAILTFREWFIV